MCVYVCVLPCRWMCVFVCVCVCMCVSYPVGEVEQSLSVRVPLGPHEVLYYSVLGHALEVTHHLDNQTSVSLSVHIWLRFHSFIKYVLWITCTWLIGWLISPLCSLPAWSASHGTAPHLGSNIVRTKARFIYYIYIVYEGKELTSKVGLSIIKYSLPAVGDVDRLSD